VFQNERGSSPLFSESAFSRSPLRDCFQIFRRKNRQRIRATKYATFTETVGKPTLHRYGTGADEQTFCLPTQPAEADNEISACIQAKLSVSCGRHTCPLPGGGY
jgi:hypothetical protein